MCFGIIGMLFCLSGLSIGIGELIWESSSDRLLLGQPYLIGQKMLLLELGAISLFVSAALRGKAARLYQVMELAMVAYGAVFFMPIADEIKLAIRVVVSCTVLVTLWRLGLLNGTLNKVAAIGLDALCYGQLVNSDAAFFFGALALSAFSYVAVRRGGGWIDKLWLSLNVPFALAALTSWIVPLTQSLGLLPTIELFLGIGLVAFVAIVIYIGERLPWKRLAPPDSEVDFVPSPKWSTPSVQVYAGQFSPASHQSIESVQERCRQLKARLDQIDENQIADELLLECLKHDRAQIEQEYQALSLALAEMEVQIRHWHNSLFADRPEMQIPTPGQLQRPDCGCSSQDSDSQCWTWHVSHGGAICPNRSIALSSKMHDLLEPALA